MYLIFIFQPSMLCIFANIIVIITGSYLLFVYIL